MATALEHPAYMLSDETTSRLDQCRLVPDRLSSLYYRARLYPETNADGIPSVSYSFPQPTLLALLLSRLLDAVIFTSAIAITAYNYWAGELLNPMQKQAGLLASAPSSSSASQSVSSLISSSSHHHHRQQHQQYQQQHMTDTASALLVDRRRRSAEQQTSDNKLVDTRRQRTEEWAECLGKPQQQHRQQQQQQQHSQHRPSQQQQQQRHHRHSTYAQPTLASINKSQANQQRTKHRSKSFDQPREEQDEMLARMQTQLQNLIQEGQAALTSTVDVYGTADEDDDYITALPRSTRNTRAMKRYHSA
ncbi:hypothetical protein BDB00DRAFT_798243 [Zychaea mexicana]|uniref:uncharacterized protein n=1 Tax=Zychaea mexicana TaxID=64656 RepID=UPI0022FF2DA7|nr:uncharacterized protein BDB00DRAFT_798243 [Zychaea mexicana]KAI9499077.1 hypothetical protein BDB00DRAFT_798243 [Zychaea mexicana]